MCLLCVLVSLLSIHVHIGMYKYLSKYKYKYLTKYKYVTKYKYLVIYKYKYLVIYTNTNTWSYKYTKIIQIPGRIRRQSHQRGGPRSRLARGSLRLAVMWTLVYHYHVVFIFWFMDIINNIIIIKIKIIQFTCVK